MIFLTVADQFSTVETIQYQKCKEKLNDTQRADLNKKIDELKKNPSPPLTKPLMGNLKGKYTVRFFNQTYRLIITINLNAKIINLLYLAPRSVVYNNTNMW